MNRTGRGFSVGCEAAGDKIGANREVEDLERIGDQGRGLWRFLLARERAIRDKLALG
jgi:hypothetical protein